MLVNLLDRERADFFTALRGASQQLSDRCVAVELPIGAEHEFRGVVDLVHMVAYLHGDGAAHDEAVDRSRTTCGAGRRVSRPPRWTSVGETSDELMERYLEGGEISREEMAVALKKLVTEGRAVPGRLRRGHPQHRHARPARPDRRGAALAGRGRRNVPEVGGRRDGSAYVFKTIADPFSGKVSLLRVFAGTMTGDSRSINSRTHGKERVAS